MRAGSNVVNQADILSIFSVTPELYQNHGLFCRALQEHFRSFDLFNDPGFGKIFLDRVRPPSQFFSASLESHFNLKISKQTDFFILYPSYINNYNHAIATLNRCKQNKAFTELLQV